MLVKRPPGARFADADSNNVTEWNCSDDVDGFANIDAIVAQPFASPWRFFLPLYLQLCEAIVAKIHNTKIFGNL